MTLAIQMQIFCGSFLLVYGVVTLLKGLINKEEYRSREVIRYDYMVISIILFLLMISICLK